jgi:hypothetical protein
MIIRAGIEAKAHFTMNQTILLNFMLMSTIVTGCESGSINCFLGFVVTMMGLWRTRSMLSKDLSKAALHRSNSGANELLSQGRNTVSRLISPANKVTIIAPNMKPAIGSLGHQWVPAHFPRAIMMIIIKIPPQSFFSLIWRNASETEVLPGISRSAFS